VTNLVILKVYGGTIKGYGCPILSTLGSALALSEVARVDANCSKFLLLNTCLVILTILMCGSDDQKKKYLPYLAQIHTMPCWYLIEPNYENDVISLNTISTKV
jgi:alkylation response protein AidB-like acyl-CoA dehydrogenase